MEPYTSQVPSCPPSFFGRRAVRHERRSSQPSSEWYACVHQCSVEDSNAPLGMCTPPAQDLQGTAPTVLTHCRPYYKQLLCTRLCSCFATCSTNFKDLSPMKPNKLPGPLFARADHLWQPKLVRPDHFWHRTSFCVTVPWQGGSLFSRGGPHFTGRMGTPGPHPPGDPQNFMTPVRAKSGPADRFWLPKPARPDQIWQPKLVLPCQNWSYPDYLRQPKVVLPCYPDYLRQPKVVLPCPGLLTGKVVLPVGYWDYSQKWSYLAETETVDLTIYYNWTKPGIHEVLGSIIIIIAFPLPLENGLWMKQQL